MDRILFIDGCVRGDSRTKRLAQALLKKLGGKVEVVKLHEVNFPVSDAAFIAKRDSLLEKSAFDDPMFDMARQFASCDVIVVAVPFWDLSFPASFKQYIEQINVSGITFMYTEEGVPKGLCKARKLYYVTTAGGVFFPQEFGFGYVKSLAENFYGIGDVEFVKAVGLDMAGADPDKIVKEAIKALG